MLTTEKSSVIVTQNQEKLKRGHSTTATVYVELAIVLMCNNTNSIKLTQNRKFD